MVLVVVFVYGNGGTGQGAFDRLFGDWCASVEVLCADDGERMSFCRVKFCVIARRQRKENSLGNFCKGGGGGLREVSLSFLAGTFQLREWWMGLQTAKQVFFHYHWQLIGRVSEACQALETAEKKPISDQKLLILMRCPIRDLTKPLQAKRKKFTNKSGTLLAQPNIPAHTLRLLRPSHWTRCRPLYLEVLSEVHSA